MVVTIRTLIRLAMADVDIKLLKEKDQETDKREMFSVREVREQLENSTENIFKTLESLGYDLEKSITK